MKAVDIAQTTVSNVSITIAAANPLRKYLVVVNTTANPIRVGFTNPMLTTTGTRLAQGEKFILEGPACPTQAVLAIREGGVDGGISGYEVSKS